MAEAKRWSQQNQKQQLLKTSILQNVSPSAKQHNTLSVVTESKETDPEIHEEFFKSCSLHSTIQDKNPQQQQQHVHPSNSGKKH